MRLSESFGDQETELEPYMCWLRDRPAWEGQRSAGDPAACL